MVSRLIAHLSEMDRVVIRSFCLWLRLQLKITFFFSLPHKTWNPLASSLTLSSNESILHPLLVSFTHRLQLHLFRHFHKPLKPWKIHPPEDESTEISKEAHCFRSRPPRGALGNQGRKKKKLILESEWSLFHCRWFKPRLVKASGLCKAKKKRIEVFLQYSP